MSFLRRAISAIFPQKPRVLIQGPDTDTIAWFENEYCVDGEFYTAGEVSRVVHEYRSHFNFVCVLVFANLDQVDHHYITRKVLAEIQQNAGLADIPIAIICVQNTAFISNAALEPLLGIESSKHPEGCGRPIGIFRISQSSSENVLSCFSWLHGETEKLIRSRKKG